jgi:hypothetical protein
VKPDVKGKLLKGMKVGDKTWSDDGLRSAPS